MANIKINGVVEEALPDTKFRIRLESGEEILAYLAGKMRLYRIRILPGDTVTIEMASLSDKRGRIVRRL